MIVDHLPKINVIRPDSANQHRFRSPLKALAKLGLFLVLTGILCQCSSAQGPANSTKATKVQKKEPRKPSRFVARGRFEDGKITESSGVTHAGPAADGTASNAIWTLNDSGNEAKLFRVSIRDDDSKGHTEATLKLKGTKNRDWETMCGFAIGEERFLAVGDVGDNLFRHKTYKIHVVPEPIVKQKLSKKGNVKVKELKASPFTIDFKYEDGPHNCEAMSYNSDDKEYWFVEKVYVNDKRKTAPGIYVLPDPGIVAGESGKGKPVGVAKRVADFAVRNVTGMAFSPDNQQLVIRSYFGAWLYEKADGKTWQETVSQIKAKPIRLPLQTQGEAICFSADGKSLLVTSEFKNAIVWQVNLEQAASKEKNEAGK